LLAEISLKNLIYEKEVIKMSEEKKELDILNFSSGQAMKMMNAFEEMYYSDYIRLKKKAKKLEEKADKDELAAEELKHMKYWRHRVLWGRENGIIYIQQIPNSGLNEFILVNPTEPDLKIVTGFCSTYNLDFTDFDRLLFKKASDHY
jgi:hypothetical protein